MNNLQLEVVRVSTPMPVRREEEEGEFSFLVDTCSSHLCTETEADFRRHVPALASHPGLEFRVVLGPRWCKVYGRRHEWQSTRVGRRAQAVKEGKQDFPQGRCIQAVILLLSGLVGAGLALIGMDLIGASSVHPGIPLGLGFLAGAVTAALWLVQCYNRAIRERIARTLD